MAQATITRLGTYLPIVRWLPHYRSVYLRSDILAGLAVASVAIPTALGYATVAGAPVQAGLYALPAALLLYAVFGSSRQVSVGPTSTVAIMSGAVIYQIGGDGMDPARAAALTAAVAMAAGIVLLLSGMLRTGWMTDIISRPVITGFTIGLSIVVILSELPHLLGVPTPSGGFVPRLTQTLSMIPQASGSTVVIGVLALAIVFIGPRVSATMPWSLLLMAAGIIGAAWLHPENSDIEVLGAIPSGLPTFQIPAISVSDIPQVLLGGASVALAGIGEGLAAGRTFATRGNYRIDADQELAGTGAANVASGLVGGMSVTGSLSRTATAAITGGKTQVTGLIAAACVIVVLLFLTGLLSNVPRVVLSAIVIASVWPLLDWKTLAWYRRIRRNDFVAALTALFGVLLFGPLYGLLAAIAISVLGITLRSSQVTIDELGKIPGEKAGWGAVGEHAERTLVPGVLVLRINAPVFWANSSRVVELVLHEVDARPDTRVVVLDLEATSQMDSTTLASLDSLLTSLRAEGIDLYLARVMYAARLVMEHAGFSDQLGDGHIWHSISQTVREARDSIA